MFFPFDDRVLFKHYFDGSRVFARLKQYYNNQQYRVKVPPGEFPELREFLADNGYALRVARDFDPYVVVVQKYTNHPENIFKDSVFQRGDGDSVPIKESSDRRNRWLLNQLIIVVIVGAVPVIVTSPVIGVICIIVPGAVIVCIIIATGAVVAGVVRVVVAGVVRVVVAGVVCIIVTATFIPAKISASSQSKDTAGDDGCVKEPTT